MKRTFGLVEVLFDGFYLLAGLLLGGMLLLTGTGTDARLMAGIMALVLVGGDSFHLIPRMYAFFAKEEEQLRPALGRGKQITSVTMTIFYLLLWEIGVLLFLPTRPIAACWIIYMLAAVRIVLCLLPQNRWKDRYPPTNWGVLRNLPFFIEGMMTAGLFFRYSGFVAGLTWMWLAIALSFLFYLPVVLFANRNPKIGMLMLPKTCMYLWILIMCTSL